MNSALGRVPGRAGMGAAVIAALSCRGDGRLCAARRRQRPGPRPPSPVRCGWRASAYVDTGDPLPDWANAVVPVENVEALDDAGAAGRDPPPPGPHPPARGACRPGRMCARWVRISSPPSWSCPPGTSCGPWTWAQSLPAGTHPSGRAQTARGRPAHRQRTGPGRAASTARRYHRIQLDCPGSPGTGLGRGSAALPDHAG